MGGSGIIPAQFKKIRQVVKDVILNNFFNEEYLNYYVRKQIKTFDLEGMVSGYLNSPEASEQAGKVLRQYAPGMENLWPMFKPAIEKYLKNMIPMMRRKLLKKDMVDDLTKVKES